MNPNSPTLRQQLNVLPGMVFVITEFAYVNGKYYSFRTAWDTKYDGSIKDEMQNPANDFKEFFELPVMRVSLSDNSIWYVDVRRDLPTSEDN